jgi:arginine deiminase
MKKAQYRGKFQVDIRSEVGELEGVILHTPGPEVEKMTPGNVQKALYNDILNLPSALREYNQFEGFLKKVTRTFQIKDLLANLLENNESKKRLISQVTKLGGIEAELSEELLEMSPHDLSTALIEGMDMKRDSLTKFLSKDRYMLDPLHNFFFSRDASVSICNQVLISRMSSRIRDREPVIMDAIFNDHPIFGVQTIRPEQVQPPAQDFSFEGGDFLIAREDILLIGTGSRTTLKGIDFIIDYYKNKKARQYIIVQELPYTPESFIHLDMVFTFLDRNQCMIYEPLVIHPNRYLTILITLDNGKVKSITEEANIPAVLKKLGMDLELLACGGTADIVNQEREQWHSGANFFAVGPGMVIGYSRNVHTIEELNRHGYEVIRAKEVIKGNIDISTYSKYVVTIDGAELARGGGGCRCMTMPLRRKPVE